MKTLFSIVTGVTALLAVSTALAQIRTDASLGQAARTLSGPNFAIPQTLGKLSGNNLFHSFQTFNLSTGEVASFSTTSPGIANVISRVTGGDASQINGTLRLTAASGAPAFFFINPAGITFGAGASVDVPGALHVSTANSVKFADGRFNADLGQGSTLSSAAPEAFGFLGGSRATVFIGGDTLLKPKRTNPISVVGGDIVIDQGAVATAAGELRVVAVGTTAADIALAGSLPTVTGNLSVINRGYILASDLGTAPAGPVTVSAGDVLLASGGNISSLTESGSTAGDVLVQAVRITLDTQGYIYSSALPGSAVSVGNGANIALAAADSITVRGQGSVSSDTHSAGNAGSIRLDGRSISVAAKGYVASDAFSTSTGNTGKVSLAATETIALSGLGKVYTSTDGPGQAGSVSLAAADISLGSGSTVHSFALSGLGNAGALDLRSGRTLSLVDDAAIISASLSSGNAGAVRISATDIALGNHSKITSSAVLGSTGNASSIDISARGTLSLRDGSFIDSTTYSAGQGGPIKVTAKNLTLDSNSLIASLASAGSGNGGNIELASSNQISLSNDSAITANTFTAGDAGSLQISAHNISLSSGGRMSNASTGDTALAGNGGNAGRLGVVATGTLSISGGSISSSTFTSGRAGTVDIKAADIVIDGNRSFISALAFEGSSGQTGAISLQAANSIAVSNGGYVSISNFAESANVAALKTSTLLLSSPSISITGNAQVYADSTGSIAASNIDVRASRQLNLASSTMTTASFLGNGGRIDISGTGVVRMDEAQITTSVAGATGNGGDIRISADALVLNTGFIQANTAAKSASGGLVDLDVKTLVASGNLAFIGGQSSYSFAPGVFGFNVIQAAAPTGVSGRIDITSPVLDLSGSLGRISAQVADAAPLGRTACQITGGSSLAQVGQGKLPASYRGLLGAPTTNPKLPSTSAITPAPDIRLALLTADCK